jgi:hypothetical protein
MKKVYNFKVNKKEEVEEQKEVEVEGKKFSRPEKVTKEVPKPFFIRKPNRSLWDQAELFNGSVWAESVKHGMLMEQMLFKRFKDDNGYLAKTDNKRRAELIGILGDKHREYEKLEIKEKTPEVESQIKELLQEIGVVRDELVKYEQIEQALFQNTAEARAKAKTTIWWVLHLAYQEENGKVSPVFGEGDYDEKLKKYDELEESEDAFWSEVLQKFIFFTTFYLSGRAKGEEDFKKVEEVFRAEFQKVE